MNELIVLFIVVSLISYGMSQDIQKAFADNEIVPDVLKVAPKNILKVFLVKTE